MEKIRVRSQVDPTHSSCFRKISSWGHKGYCKQVQVSQSALRKWWKNLHLYAGTPKVGINRFRKISTSASQENFEELNSFVLLGPQGLRMVGLSLSELARVWRGIMLNLLGLIAEVWVFIHSIDARKSYDGLYGLVKIFHTHSLSGDVFWSVSKHRKKPMVLAWSGFG